MSEDKNQNPTEKGRNKYKNLFAIFIVILFTVIILLNAIFMVNTQRIYLSKTNEITETIKNNLNQQDKNNLNEQTQNDSIKITGISFEPIAESNLLTTGLEMIGLAIAVWTGLNIANAISRKEVDEQKAKIDELEKRTNELQNQNKRAREEMEKGLKEIQDENEELSEIHNNNINNMNKNEFLKELLKSNNDVMSRFFYEKFSQMNANEDIFYKLLLIEQLFAQIYYIHTSDNNDFLKYLTEKMEEKINDILSSEVQVNNKDITNYLKFRKAEGLFYRGYVLDGEEEIYKAYITAIKIYKEISEYFIKNFEEVIENKGKKISIEDYEVFAYYANTLGEGYSKILQKCPEYAEIDEIGENAKFYCELTIKYAKKNDREVYYRNLGCAYERLEKAKRNSFKMYNEEILENYEKAFKLTINNPQMSRKQMGNVYHAYLSYLNGYIQNKLEIDSPEKIDINNILNKLNENENNNIIECIDKIYEVVYVAIVDDIRKSLNVIMYGLANGYVALKQINDRKIAKVSNYNINDYLEKMQWAIDTLTLMGIYDEDNKYAKQLKSLHMKLTEYVK